MSDLPKNPYYRHIFKDEGDDHIHVIVDSHITACQHTMQPEITRAQQCGEAAHKRLDTMDNTYFNKETGQVTVMWTSHKLLKRTIFVTSVTLLTSMILTSLVSFYNISNLTKVMSKYQMVVNDYESGKFNKP
jgi:hypothetical protein